MTTEQNDEPLTEDGSLIFENLLAEIRTVDCKDRTKYLVDAINTDLSDLMQGIAKYNESGKMIITLDFQVSKKSKEMNIIADIQTKKPKGKITSNTFYRDNKGKIYLDDPELFNNENNVRNIR